MKKNITWLSPTIACQGESPTSSRPMRLTNLYPQASAVRCRRLMKCRSVPEPRSNSGLLLTQVACDPRCDLSEIQRNRVACAWCCDQLQKLRLNGVGVPVRDVIRYAVRWVFIKQGSIAVTSTNLIPATQKGVEGLRGQTGNASSYHSA